MDNHDLITVDSDFIKKIIKPRKVQSRKGENGIVLIVGGSRIYHGAPLLSSVAALISGTDLVYTAIPKINIVSSRMFSPNLIFIPLPDDKLTMGSSRKLLSLMPKKPHSAAIGMGLGISKTNSLCFLIRQLLEYETRLLFDASSLIPDILHEITNTKSIVTPHAGEFKRLFGQDPGQSKSEQIDIVLRKAKEFGIVVVLKGYLNIVSDGESISVIERTTPSMTVGGTGDVLSGLISGFLTKNNPFESSILGLFFNGVAGNRLYNKFGLHLMASNFLEELPLVMKEFDRLN
ncbi:MAG TPA: NAD(P)H-hydrate dehydratase [Nitrososphaeraceae archaeon]|nr:NAD(P)H-hydrate dehydratase [Nitrososphaeraceae archaeon]